MDRCLNRYGTMLSFLNEGDKYSVILNSWSYLKEACDKFGYLESCLGKEIIKECLNFQQFWNPFGSSSSATLGLLYHGAKFACQKGYDGEAYITKT